MPNKLLIAVVGTAMIGILLYPPLLGCGRGGFCHYLHMPIWEDWYTPNFTQCVLPIDARSGTGLSSANFLVFKIDLVRLALYELAMAGIGALIHFLTRK